MPWQKIINSSAARTGIYIVLAGGLLVLFAFGSSFICNSFLSATFGIPAISFMEAAGGFAFVYIIYYGYRFGFCSRNKSNEKRDLSFLQNCDNLTQHNLNYKAVTALNKEQKEKLREEIARCCGFKHESSHRSSRIS